MQISPPAACGRDMEKRKRENHILWVRHGREARWTSRRMVGEESFGGGWSPAFQEKHARAEVLRRWLRTRVRTDLAEGQSWVPSTGGQLTACNSNSSGSDTIFWPSRPPRVQTSIPIHTQASTHKQLKNKILMKRDRRKKSYIFLRNFKNNPLLKLCSFVSSFPRSGNSGKESHIVSASSKHPGTCMSCTQANSWNRRRWIPTSRSYLFRSH